MSQKFKSDIEAQAGIRDSSGAIGTSGQVLSSTGSNVSWINQTTVASDVQNLVKAGVAINKGQAVYVTGANGTNIIVGLASNTSEATSSKTLGLLNATVAINGMADVVQIGRLAGLNTIGATVGDPVWLGTNGNLIYGLANKPYAPAHLVFLGIVTRVNSSNGEIFVNVQNGFELKEIHDVDIITNVPINGDLLGYNGTLWVNKTIAEWLGYTPANASGTTNYVSKFTGATTLGNSQIFDNGTNVGVGTASPARKLDVNGDAFINGLTVGRGSSNQISNSAFGQHALDSNTTGTGNTAIGYYSLNLNTTGSTNTAIGDGSLSSIEYSNWNTSIGSGALGSLLDGDFNTCIGGASGALSTSSIGMTLIGYDLKYKPSTLNTPLSNNELAISQYWSESPGRPHFYAPDKIFIDASTNTEILSVSWDAYNAFFVDYSFDDASGNLRAGTIKCIFTSSGGFQYQLDDQTTNSIGTTADLTFDVIDDGSHNAVLRVLNVGGASSYIRFTSRLLFKTI
jgi:hypothetical protein